MEYQNRLPNIDPQDDHDTGIISSDPPTDFTAENTPPTGSTSAPTDALGSVNEQPINSAETLTDATIKDTHRRLANLMEPYASQIATHRRLANLMEPYASQIATHRRLANLMEPYASQIATHRRLANLMEPYASQIATHRRLANLMEPYASQIATHRRLANLMEPYASQIATHRRLANLMEPYASQIATHHRLANLMEPYASQIATHRRLANLMEPYASQIATHRRLANLMEPYASQIASVSRRLADLTNPFIEARRRGQLLERHEWFPHYTMPEFLFGGHIGDADFNALVLAYYRENWAEVRQMIEQNLSDCPVDGETKAAFHEALDSHASGRYLSVCRNLLPELERLVRIHLYGDKVGSFSVEKQMDIYFGNLPVSVFPDRSLGWIGFKYLQNHLYAHIKDEADRERYVNHQIPNRHAAIHGLVTYDNVQNSLNSIFVADYVLQLITAWKAFERNAVLNV